MNSELLLGGRNSDNRIDFTIHLNSISGATIGRQVCYKIGKWVFIGFLLQVTTTISAGGIYLFSSSTSNIPKPITNSDYADGSGVVIACSNNGNIPLVLLKDGGIYTNLSIPIGSYSWSFVYASDEYPAIN